MSNIVPFIFENHQVRVLTDADGKALFVAKDVAEALGYKDTVNAIKQHCRGVVIHHPIADALGRTQEVRVIREPDMYRLIFGSNLPSAQDFEKVVVEEILPAIRETGQYSTTPRTYIAALKDLIRAEEEKEAAVKKLEAEKPYAEIGHLVTSKDVMTRRDWVALMKTDWGVKIKEHSLNQFLQDRKYIYLDQLDRRARAYAQYDRYFKLDLEPINGLLLPVLKITGEGVKELTPIVVKHFSQQA